MTAIRHQVACCARRLLQALYRGRVARLNLRLSDDLHAAVTREAAKAGIDATAWAREAIAWRIGRADADDLAARVAKLEAEVTRLRAENDESAPPPKG